MATIQLLLTGNEIMSGHTLDSNSSLIAEQLSTVGQAVFRKVTIGDDLAQLTQEITDQSMSSDILIINGGLGPTTDDLTAEAMSAATNTPLKEHAKALSHVTNWCHKRQLQMNEANRKQAILPKGAAIIDNPTGSAVGFSCELNNCLVICTPGVPSELQGMMRESITTMIANRFPDHPAIATHRLQTFGIGESTLQERIRNECPNWPQEVELGFRAGLPLLEIKLTIRNPHHLPQQQACYQHLKNIIGDCIIGDDSASLASAVVSLLQEHQQTLCLAESCTGGQIASAITTVPGASQVFEAGFVTYSNAMKEKMLGVNPKLLIKHGAVSKAVVLAMAQGALTHSEASLGIAVSGIAGPDGGSTEKPVGTVYIAWGKSGKLNTLHLKLNAPRQWFQTMVTAICLDLIRRELLNIKGEPHYLQRYKHA